MTRRIFVFGYGYTAAALGRRLRAAGWAVAGTTRSAEKAARLAADGVEAVLDADRSAVARALNGSDAILISSAPDADGDPTLAAHGAALAAAAPAARWIGYLSTTGVYGDRGGDWVDETSERRPESRRGRWRVAAEDAWLDHVADGWPVHVFRLAGIYGPGRGPFAKIRNGTARRIAKRGQVFSRIHVEDAARALAASIERSRAGAAYNLCDDEPAPPQDVIAHAAELLGLEPPPLVRFEEVEAEMSPMARSFYGESKRVSNRLMREQLVAPPQFPTYREGLADILAAERLAAADG